MALTIETARFFDDRLLRLTALVKQTFVRLRSDTAADDVLGLALVTDPDADHLTVAIYRRRDHDENLASAHRRYPDSDVDWDLYLRWAPEEWPRSTDSAPVTRASELDDLWAELRDRQDTAIRPDRRYWPSLMYEIAANVMIVLHRDGWFEEYPHGIRLFHVSGGDVDRPTRRRWVEGMNTAAAAESFLVASGQRLPW